jgi:hypothetical protein
VALFIGLHGFFFFLINAPGKTVVVAELVYKGWVQMNPTNFLNPSLI